MTVPLPATSATVTSNLVAVPVTISWDGNWLQAQTPTNQIDLALRFVCVRDNHGRQANWSSGSWSRFSFSKGSFMTIRADSSTGDNLNPSSLAFVMVPNLHGTSFAQPQLLNTQEYLK